jgi:hypothetical protein
MLDSMISNHCQLFSVLLLFLWSFLWNGILVDGYYSVPVLIPNGLVAYYPFDGNANDMSNHGHHGAVHTGVTSAADRFGNPSHALSFDGSTGYIEIPGQDFNFPTDLTISFWARPEASQVPFARIMDKSVYHTSPNQNKGGFQILHWNYDASNYTFNSVYTNNQLAYFRKVNIPPNVWSHFTVVKSFNQIFYYLNGNLTSFLTTPTEQSNIVSTDDLPLTIGTCNGGHTHPASGPISFFKGVLDEIYIYNRPLSVEEVLRIYQDEAPTSQPTGQPLARPTNQPTGRPTTQPTTKPTEYWDLPAHLKNGLVAFYPFNGNAEDKSGNVQHGTAHSVAVASDRFGKPQSAFSFNGGYVEIPGYGFHFSAGEFTLSFWIKPFDSASQTATLPTILDKSLGNAGFSFYSDSPAMDEFFLKWMITVSGSAVVEFSPSIPTATSGSWVHIVTTVASDLCEVYVNGVSMAFHDVNGSIRSNNLPLIFGGRNSGLTVPASNVTDFYRGLLDDVMIYDRVLTAGEVQELYSMNNYLVPTGRPTTQPTDQPSGQPTNQPTGQPTGQPTEFLDLPNNLKDGLVAFYPCGVNAVDKSGNGHHGTPQLAVSASTDRFGNSQGASFFNGGGYVEIPGQAFNFSGGKLSLSFWVNPVVGQSTAFPTILDKSFGDAGFSFFFATSSNHYFLKWMISAASGVTSVISPVTANSWVHIGIVIVNDNLNVYTDGVLQGTVPQNTHIRFNNLPLIFGARNLGGTNPATSLTDFYRGFLDDVLIYDRALTAPEINQLYYLNNYLSPTGQPSEQPLKQPTGQPSSHPTFGNDLTLETLPVSLQSDLVAYYPFDGNANDKSGNHHHGIIHGDVLSGYNRFGNGVRALYFNGVNSSIEIPGEAFAFNSLLSLSLWIRPFIWTGSGTILDKSVAVTNGGFRLIRLTSNSNTVFEWIRTPAAVIATGSPMKTPTDKWTHITVVFDHSAFRHYVDGMLNSSTSYSSPISYIKSSRNLPLLFGATNGGITDPASNLANYFRGLIDDVMIFNRSLSTEDVQLLYNFNQPTSQPTSQPSSLPSAKPSYFPTTRINPSSLKTGLVAYYPFDGDARDTSGNGHHGTINGGSDEVFGVGRNDRSASAYLSTDNRSISIPGSAFNFNYTVSISLWVRHVAQSPYSGFVFSKSGGYSLYYYPGNQYLFRATAENNTVVVSPVFEVVESEWNHIAIVITDEGVSRVLNVYVNGRNNGERTTFTDRILSNGDFPLVIGAPDVTGAGTSFYHGKIDDLMIFNRSLSAEEVQILFDFHRPTSLPSNTPTSQPTTQPTNLINPSSLKTGLVAFYPLDGGSANDKGGNSINGAIHGGVGSAVADRNGFPNKAFSFDGFSSYVEIPGDHFQFSESITISFWIRLSLSSSQTDVEAAVISKSTFTDGGNYYDGWVVRIVGDNRLEFGYVSGDSGSLLIYSHVIPAFDEWEHVAFVKTGGNVNGYINGKFAMTDAAEVSQIWDFANSPLLIGATTSTDVNTAPVANYFHGELDDIFIYNRSLSLSEVRLLARFDSPTSQPTNQPSYQPSEQPTNQPSYQPTSKPSSQPSITPVSLSDLRKNLVGYYSFDSTVQDESGNNHDPIKNGVMIFELSDRFNTEGNALHFFESEWLEFPGNVLNLTSKFSLSFWVQPSDNFPAATILSIGHYLGNGVFVRSFYVEKDEDERYHGFAETATGMLEFSLFLFMDVWNHLTIVKSDSVMEIYVNGDIISNMAAPLPFAQNSIVSLGANFNGTSPWNGLVDDLWMFNRTLVPKEIQFISTFTGSILPPTQQPSEPPVPISELRNNLVGYYSFNNSTQDESGNNHHPIEGGGLSFNFDRFNNSDGALYFNGTEWIEFPENMLNQTTEFSLSFWIKPLERIPSNMVFSIGKRVEFDYFSSYFLEKGTDPNSGPPLARYYGNAETTGPDDFEAFSFYLDFERWNHLTVMKSASSLGIYVNRVRVANVDVPARVTGSSFLTLGADFDGSSGWTGFIDDLWIFNRTLGRQELQFISTFTGTILQPTTQPTALPAAQPSHSPILLPSRHPSVQPSRVPTSQPSSRPSTGPTLEKGLIAFYPLDGNVNDQSGNGHHGTVRGQTDFTVDRLGNSQRAFAFNGHTAIELPGNVFNFASNMTVSVWLKLRSSESFHQSLPFTILDKSFSQFVGSTGVFGTGGFVLSQDLEKNNRYSFWWATAYRQYTGAYPLSMSLSYTYWSHLVFSKNGKQLKAYFNGKLAFSFLANSTQIYSNQDLPLLLGGANLQSNNPATSGVDSYYFGCMDELRFYNRPLSAFEVKLLYDSPQPTIAPSRTPTATPVRTPTHSPTRIPTVTPTVVPTSFKPSLIPMIVPTTPASPSKSPVVVPTARPSDSPIVSPVSAQPSVVLQSTEAPSTTDPSLVPVGLPTERPSDDPTAFPTSSSPSFSLTSAPTRNTLADGLVAYYPFDGNVNDVSGKGNHGTVQGTVQYETDRNNNIGNSLQFNGENTFVELPGNPFNFTTRMSICLWLKLDPQGDKSSCILDKSFTNSMYGTVGIGGFTLYQNDVVSQARHGSRRTLLLEEGDEQLQVPDPNPGGPGGGGGGGQRYVDPGEETVDLQRNCYFNWATDSRVLAGEPNPVTIALSAWTHLVFSKDDLQLSVYLNGKLVDSFHASSPIMHSNGDLPLILGAQNSGGTKPASTVSHFYHGAMDDLRFYDRPLTLDEVNLLFTMVNPPSDSIGTPIPTIQSTTAVTTDQPTTLFPTIAPSSTLIPTNMQPVSPSRQPTVAGSPSYRPTVFPKMTPTAQPTSQPTNQPSARPSWMTRSPSFKPSLAPTAVIPMSAMLSNDGLSIIISFLYSTDRAQMSVGTVFPCDRLFNFPCANNSSCEWKEDSRSVIVTFITPASDQCAGPGSSLSLLSSAVIMVDSKKLLINTPIKISAPVHPVVPSVSLNVPETISYCASLDFDLSNSQHGTVGRSWRNFSVSVMTDPPGMPTNSLLTVIKRKYQVVSPRLTPPLTVNSSYFKENVKYSFKVSLCNYLGACNSDQKTVQVIHSIVPSVSFIGDAVQTITRSNFLSVLSSVKSPVGCSDLSLSSLTYNWTVTRLINNENSLAQPLLKSVSKDPSRFLLNPYSLASNRTYLITLETSIGSSLSAAKASVRVIVAEGSIIATIRGNSNQNTRVNEVVTVDASPSYDSDSQTTSVSYAWTCIQLQPVVNGSCSTLFDSTLFQTTKQTASLKVKPLEVATNAVVKLSVKVFDPTRPLTRYSAASMRLTVFPAIYPTINLTSNALLSGKINPSQSLKLTAVVNLPAFTLSSIQGNISWSMSGGNFTLGQIVKTPVKQPLSVGDATTLMKSFYLSVLPNSLTAGLSYSFALQCSLSTGIQVTSSITVTINAPPSSGSFLIDPSTGTEVTTSFSFQCNNWIDSDLPLTYQFSYLSSSSSGGGTGSHSALIIKSLSQLSYTVSSLPAGDDHDDQNNDNSNNYQQKNTLICQAQVFDSLNANTSVVQSVQVKPLVDVNLTALVRAALDTTSKKTTILSVDETVRATNLMTSLLNRHSVNCSAAPNCTKLNRFSCRSTSHTCGPCRSPTYLSSSSSSGVSGDSNEMCYKLAEVSSATVSTVLKRCQFDCSRPHGECVYYSAAGQTNNNNRQRLDSCFEGDLSCYSSCQCKEGYQLSPYCDISDEEIQKKIQLRDLVIETMVANTKYQDIREQVVVGWVDSLRESSTLANEISETSFANLIKLSKNALSAVQGSGYSASSSLYKFAEGLDRLANAISYLNISRTASHSRRRLTESSDPGLEILSNIKSYSSLVVSDLVPGENPQRTLGKNFRFHIEHISLEEGEIEDEKDNNNNHRRKLVSSHSTSSGTTATTTCSNAVSVDLPSTPLEERLGQSSTSISLPACSKNFSSFQFSAISMSSSLLLQSSQSSGQAFTSNPLSLSLSSLSCSNFSDCHLGLSFESYNEGIGLSIASVNRTVECADYSHANHTVSCPNHKNYTVSCHGRKKETIVFRCPAVYLVQKCKNLDLQTKVLTPNNCEVSAKEETQNTSCACPLKSLSKWNNNMHNSRHSDLTYVTLLESVEENFVSTVFSAQNLDESVFTKSLVAVITVLMILLSIGVGMAYSYHADSKERNKVSLEDKMIEHAKVQSSSLYQQKLQHHQRLARTTDGEGEEGKEESLTTALFKMAEESLPQMLTKKTNIGKKIVEEEKRFHRWLAIVYYYSPGFPRILRVISLANNVLIMLFIQSLTYNYTHGDEQGSSSCEKLSNTSEEECLLPQSDYGTGRSKCYWEPATTDNNRSSSGSCHYLQPENSIEIMLFVAVFSAIVTAPIAIGTNWVVQHILAAPDEGILTNALKEEDKRQAKIVPSSNQVIPLDPSLTTRKTDRRRKVSLLDGLFRRRSSVIKATYRSEVEKDYEKLVRELLDYRAQIKENNNNNGNGNSDKDEHRMELDCKKLTDYLFVFSKLVLLDLWALNDHGLLPSWQEYELQSNNNSSSVFDRLERLLQSLQNYFYPNSTSSISKSLHDELFHLYGEVEKEKMKFQLLPTERMKSKRLLYLFQKDLIPGITGEILESKDSREQCIIPPVTQRQKAVGWLFLGVLDLGMLFYIFLFAVSQDAHHQLAWGRSLGLYLFLDIVFISSFMVIFSHVLLPMMIHRDVEKIKKKLSESVKEYCHKLENDKEKEKEKEMRRVEIGEGEEETEKEDEEEKDDYGNGSDEEEEEDGDALHKEDGKKTSKNNKKQVNSKNHSQLTTKQHQNKNKTNRTTEPFNAVKYLFVSYRLAELYADSGLPAAQMILHYSSPWPKQSYLRTHNVKGNYSESYTAFTRAISIIVIFFLTNLLATPIAIQDMILQMVATITFGYTLLVHIQLYAIFPALVIIPSIVVIGVGYGLRQWMNRRNDDKMMNNVAVTDDDKERSVLPVVDNNNTERKKSSTRVIPFNGTKLQEDVEYPQELIRTAEPTTHHQLPSVPSLHPTRRQSIQQALQITSQIQQQLIISEVNEDEKEDEETEQEQNLEEKRAEEEKLNESQEDDKKRFPENKQIARLKKTNDNSVHNTGSSNNNKKSDNNSDASFSSMSISQPTPSQHSSHSPPQPVQPLVPVPVPPASSPAKNIDTLLSKYTKEGDDEEDLDDDDFRLSSLGDDDDDITEI